jgi:hypothetical protein
LAIAQTGTPSQELLNQIQQISAISNSALAAATEATSVATEATSVATEAATTAAEAAALAQEIYNSNYGNNHQDLIDQIEYVASMSSSAFAAATSIATAATSIATEAASAATAATAEAIAASAAAAFATEAAAAAAALAQELHDSSNQELIDKIEYLFMMFYRSDSSAIMENYPLYPLCN